MSGASYAMAGCLTLEARLVDHFLSANKRDGSDEIRMEHAVSMYAETIHPASSFDLVVNHNLLGPSRMHHERTDRSIACMRTRVSPLRSEIADSRNERYPCPHTHQLVPWLQHIYGHKICHQTSRLAGRNSCLQALVIRSATHKPMDGPLASTSIVLWWGGCNLELSHSRRSIRRREPTYKSNVGTSPLFFVLQNNRRSASTILLLDIG
jgi:hypothetical protein